MINSWNCIKLDHTYSIMVSLFSVFTILVPTECRLPPWTVVLVGLSILALVTLIGATVAIIDGISVCSIQLSKLKLNIGGCCSDTNKDPGMGEYGSVVLVIVVLVSYTCPGRC